MLASEFARHESTMWRQKSAERIADQLILYQSLYQSENYELDFAKVKEIDSASAQAIKNSIQAGVKVRRVYFLWI